MRKPIATALIAEQITFSTIFSPEKNARTPLIKSNPAPTPRKRARLSERSLVIYATSDEVIRKKRDTSETIETFFKLNTSECLRKATQLLFSGR